MSVIKITVRKGGHTKIEVQGVPGQSCKEASRPYVERLIGEVTSDEPTAEMTQQSVEERQQEGQSQ